MILPGVVADKCYCRHIVPAADLAQVLMKKVTDALSWDIFPALQTTVLAQLSGKQKEQHMQTLEQFVQDSLLHLKEHIVLPICGTRALTFLP
eukprot:SAG31_NODE_1191_length_9460_cov_62.435103_6_plen_92_part_00